MYNVISDIAGQFLTLQALIAKMPAGTVLSVGDMIDRGPRSREVVEFFMGGGGEALKGNHEDMCIHHYRNSGVYHPTDWTRNGGYATLKSWGDGGVPTAVVDWMAGLPLYKDLTIDDRRYLISHAFIDWDRGGLEADPFDMMWNRHEPTAHPDYYLQICGHNSHFGLRRWGNPAHSICIDTSRAKVLTGLHLPSGKIYEQEYID